MGIFTKIKNWVLTHKLIALIMVIFLFLLVSYLILQQKMKTKQAPPSPEELKLIQITPAKEYKSIWSTEPAMFTFNLPLDEKTISYKVVPEISTRLIFEQQSPNIISVLPLNGWKENQIYTITIDEKLTSREGSKLSKSILYSFRRLFPEPGDPEYPTGIDENYGTPQP